MSNPHKGEVEFTLGKKVYTLCFSINAMCELEDALGMSVVAVAGTLSDPSKISMKNVRTLFWAGLKDHHESITQVEAGRIITELGVQETMLLIEKAFALAFPAVDASRPLEGKAANTSTGKAH